MLWKINWHSDLFTNGKNLHDKEPHRVILRSSFPKIHYYHNKRLQVKESQYLIPTYSWILIPIPNWTCSVVTISHFQWMAPNTWLINCTNPNMPLQLPTREGCWLQSFSVHHTMKIEKLLGYKTHDAQTQQLLHKKDELGQICLLSQFSWINFAQHLCNLCHLLRPLK